MSEINNDAYRKWKLSTFGSDYMTWHEGLYTHQVEALKGEARQSAIRMLVFGVNIGDSYAAQALAAMREISAVGDIRAALSKASGEDRVRFAQSIHDLVPEDAAQGTMAKYLIEVLEKSAGHWGPRINAAMGLREYKDAASEQALLKAVENDPEYLVRYHCCGSLFARWKVVPECLTDHPDLFGLIRTVREGDPIQDLATRSREAAVLLKKLRNSVEQKE